MQTHEDHL